MRQCIWRSFVCAAILGALVLSSAVAGAEGPGGGAETATNPFAGDAQAVSEGKVIFEAVCAGYCHATEGAAREGRCPNLFDCDWKHGNSDREVFQVVAAGVPQTEMVGFKGKLPDDILWKVIAYVRSASQCKGSKPAAAAAH